MWFIKFALRQKPTSFSRQQFGQTSHVSRRALIQALRGAEKYRKLTTGKHGSLHSLPPQLKWNQKVSPSVASMKLCKVPPTIFASSRKHSFDVLLGDLGNGTCILIVMTRMEFPRLLLSMPTQPHTRSNPGINLSAWPRSGHIGSSVQKHFRQRSPGKRSAPGIYWIFWNERFANSFKAGLDPRGRFCQGKAG